LFPVAHYIDADVFGFGFADMNRFSR